MIDKSEQINELATALSKAQAKFTHVKKDKTAKIRMRAGGEYTYAYADLGSTWDVARAAMTENGLSVAQLPSFADGWLILDTMLMHTSGQYLSSQMRARADEMDVKSIGSIITYLRRYAFSATIGLVADEDDDGSAPRDQRHDEQQPAQPTHTNGNADPNKASQPQIKKLFAVWAEAKYPGKLSDWIHESYGCSVNDLTKADASAAIELLQKKD